MKTAWAWALWGLAVLFVIAFGTFSSTHFALGAPDPATHEARVLAVAADLSSITVARLAPDSGRPQALQVISAAGTSKAAQALHAELQARPPLAAGDLVRIADQPASSTTPAAVSLESPPITAAVRGVTLLGAALLLLGFGWAVLGKKLPCLVVGMDGRTSNSKSQLAIWFTVVMATYLATLWLRFCVSGNLLLGAITIPNNLLLLSGMSAFSFAGAKAITQGKQNALAAAGDTNKMKIQKPGEASLSDLVQDDSGSADFGDTQMLFVAVIAAITYLVQVFIYLGAIDLHANVTLPDVDSTLLAAFGLGQGAYLAKKAASGPNPTPPPAPTANATRKAPPRAAAHAAAAHAAAAPPRAAAAAAEDRLGAEA
jgi:hypothetical protein